MDLVREEQEKIREKSFLDNGTARETTQGQKAHRTASTTVPGP